jgi:hypothetical protein
MTWFGVPVPPWKPKKLKRGATSLRFCIKGDIPSLKNNKQATTVRKDSYEHIDNWKPEGGMVSVAEAKKMAKEAVKLTRAKVIPNKKYQAFLAEQQPHIEAQAAWWVNRLGERKGLMFPVNRANVNIRFYWAHAHIQDTHNKEQSVLDLLTASRILTDDDYTVTDPHAEGQLYKDEILENICLINITVNL